MNRTDILFKDLSDSTYKVDEDSKVLSVKDVIPNVYIRIVAGCLAAKGYHKHNNGKWMLWKPRRMNRNATYKCSVCGTACSSYYNDVGAWKYCPHCGCEMKGE